MENLAYLYILAEETEAATKNRNGDHHEKHVQREQHVKTPRSSTAKTVPAVEAPKAAPDGDRAHQLYPTFYL